MIITIADRGGSGEAYRQTKQASPLGRGSLGLRTAIPYAWDIVVRPVSVSNTWVRVNSGLRTSLSSTNHDSPDSTGSERTTEHDERIRHAQRGIRWEIASSVGSEAHPWLISDSAG